ncbi:hypothetical protein ROZALSC1DRAFT_28497 [Rozella allomycis CSF55]|uniref:Radial spoke head protein 9 homolog n=1 Tax=Rozella allomycis (strain CSF55) TaxID=988480 RepID=A0A075AW87_ROZAC|nr:hypothetical protein O9G_003703 [Rozella allomycis CSF55]RKP19956.1 hypothetical protein ROZALSC1DRAFT_28497 [Rozella allomycis CSF55]|eukprot:EPZ32972.1 hypothetical protein O9G_003703 [Rozella allomycis CSF55]
MDINDLGNLANVGFTLTPEELTAVSSSLTLLQTSQGYSGVRLWGKVLGIQRDYYVAFCNGKDIVSDKNFFISFDLVQWMQLPNVTAEEKKLTSRIHQRFLGDPSYEYVIQNTKQPEVQESTTITEEKRLIAMIERIHDETFIMPRGSVYRDFSTNSIVLNPTFKGLSYDEATQMNFYYHSKPSDGFIRRSKMDPDDIIDEFDLFDALTDQNPNFWHLGSAENGMLVCLKNAKWPGSVSFHRSQNRSFGSFYFGLGVENREIGYGF